MNSDKTKDKILDGIKDRIALYEDELRIALQGVLLAKSWVQDAEWKQSPGLPTFQKLLNGAIDYYDSIQFKIKQLKGE